MTFRDRVILVTGASRGIGAAIAGAFAAEGGLVFVNYRSSEAAAEAVVEACRAAGGQAVAMQGQLNFSRDMEREADRVGFGVMTEAGFGAEGASAVAVGTKRVKDSSKTMPSISFPFSFM